MDLQLFKTKNTLSGLILRLTLGLILLPHGLQKTIGWFGGPGFSRMMGIFTEQMHLPYIVALLVIVIELLGATCLILGLATRFWAICFIGLFIGIMITTHLENGFFMNWFGNQKGEGCEFDLMTIGISIALFYEGSGKFSIDRIISEKMERNHIR